MSVTLLPESFYRHNAARIQAATAEAGLKGLLLLNPFNVIYASGFRHSPSERPIGLYLPASGEPALFVPLLEQEHAAETWIRDIRVYFEFPGEEHPVIWMARESGDRVLGVDALDHAVFAQVAAAGFDLRISSIVQTMRWVKAPEELALIRRAAAYADYCLEIICQHTGEIVRSGGSELDILRFALAETRAKMQRESAELFELRGDAIVGTTHSGPRAALPHGSPGERQPQPGEPLIAGIGAKVGGYHAESGATFILGEPNGDQLRCLRAAAACSEAAIEALRPGNRCSAVNEAALSALREAGLGAFIRHRIGHGMGLEGHEAPWLAPGDETILSPGMVFSNEPGIYRPGLDGYRTINTMIVTESAAEVPSRFLAERSIDQRVIAL
jgi:Xaa-Pro dipeptidase